MELTDGRRNVRAQNIVDDLMAQPPECGVTQAVVVVSGGAVVAEGYAVDHAQWPAGPDSTLISWSMAKSITEALVFLAAQDGLIDITGRAEVAQWRDDERSEITVEHLLQMRSGLTFVEDYVDAGISDCIEMLFGSGAADVAAYAAARPLEHPVGTQWNYSSGTTNIISRLVTNALGGGREAMQQFMRERLFGPLGMTTAIPKFDDAGTFIGSSFVYATARDFARFGLAFARNGAGVVPSDAVGWARRSVPIEVPPTESFGYGAQWWHWDRQGFPGVFAAHGYEGQYVIVVPEADAVVVRLGKTNADLRAALVERLRGVLGAIAS
jgi:CubicO group peptidase (beta-lactamase class C family)